MTLDNKQLLEKFPIFSTLTFQSQVNFIRQMNKKPIEIVEEFLTNQKNFAREKLCANGSKPYQVLLIFLKVHVWQDINNNCSVIFYWFQKSPYG